MLACEGHTAEMSVCRAHTSELMVFWEPEVEPLVVCEAHRVAVALWGHTLALATWDPGLALAMSAHPSDRLAAQSSPARPRFATDCRCEAGRSSARKPL